MKRKRRRRNPGMWTVLAYPSGKAGIVARAAADVGSAAIYLGDVGGFGYSAVYAEKAEAVSRRLGYGEPFGPDTASPRGAWNKIRSRGLIAARRHGARSRRTNPHPLAHFRRYFTPQATARLISDFADHATVTPRRRVLDARHGSRAERVRNRRLARAYAHIRTSAEIRRHALRLPRVNPHRAGTDLDAARELRLFIENDSRLYHSMFLPIVRNLVRKRAKGTYKHGLAAVAFRHLADEGARRYHEEFGGPGKWSDTFSVATRNVVARELANAFRTEAGYGNYDRV